MRPGLRQPADIRVTRRRSALARPSTAVAERRNSHEHHPSCLTAGHSISVLCAYSRPRGRGRPRIAGEIQALIGRMARENPTWRAVRNCRRAARARDRGERLDRAHLPATAVAPPAIAELAGVPAAPCAADLGGRLLHRTDADLQDALRLRAARPRAAAHRPLERRGAPDRAVGMAADHRGDALGHSPTLPDPRPRSQLRR